MSQATAILVDLELLTSSQLPYTVHSRDESEVEYK